MAQASPNFCFMPPESSREPAREPSKIGEGEQTLEVPRSRFADNAAQIRVKSEVLEHGQVVVEPEARACSRSCGASRCCP